MSETNNERASRIYFDEGKYNDCIIDCHTIDDIENNIPPDHRKEAKFLLKKNGVFYYDIDNFDSLDEEGMLDRIIDLENSI